MEKPKKEFTVYFEGNVTVEAHNEIDAFNEAYDAMAEWTPTPSFRIKSAEEGECVACGGTGTIPADEDDGEGHVAGGTLEKRCACQK